MPRLKAPKLPKVKIIPLVPTEHTADRMASAVAKVRSKGVAGGSGAPISANTPK